MAKAPLGEIQTRITTSATWTEVLGNTKGLAGGLGANDLAYADLVVTNHDTTNDAVILIAITSNSTPPAADTDAIWQITLAANAGTSQSEQFAPLLSGDAHVWVKATAATVDVRVLAVGTKDI